MWLIDDGIGSRGHQMNLLDEDMTHCGVGVYKDQDSGWFVVFNAVRNWQCTSLCNSITIDQMDSANIQGDGFYGNIKNMRRFEENLGSGIDRVDV